MTRFRETCLPSWDDPLPTVPRDAWDQTGRATAHAMATLGGTAHVQPFAPRLLIWSLRVSVL
ncbi:hypothetical protein Aph01nite_48640 [Acrocarpospora phusangensis]|uniref:Uncharacterized protein n=1 Tax=Acrocarpospora phusangensis TaxID=1070424 RepID=A0A919UM22_9ACTN|nr:hypothetical protein Aph01nite_48640 [Acrocarpospora phusangensis]